MCNKKVNQEEEVQLYQAYYFNRVLNEQFIIEAVSGLEEAWDKNVVKSVCHIKNWNIDTFCSDVIVRLMIDGKIIRINN